MEKRTTGTPRLRIPLVIAGTANPELSGSLPAALGAPLCDAAIERFPDGEIHVELREPVRGRAVYLVQSTGAPVGEALLELLLLADACRRGGASRLVALLPYVGYARQDRRRCEGEALGISAVAGVLAQGRFDRLVVVDLHAAATEGCFAAPVDQVTAVPTLAEAARRWAGDQTVVVAPDAGAAEMARLCGRTLGLPVAMVLKTRRTAAEVEVTEVIGEVAGRRPLVIDDLISTGGTIAAAVDALMRRGAIPGALVVATHLIADAGAASRLQGLPIERVIATDSLPAAGRWTLPIERVALAPLLAEVIARLARGASLGDLVSAR